MRNPVRLVRRGFAIILHAIPWTRRNVMMGWCDYQWVPRQKALKIHAAGWPGLLPFLRRRWDDRFQLEEVHLTSARGDFRAAAAALDGAELSSPSLLDVGCRGGYYSEVFKALAKTPVHYTGVDPSSSNIERALEHYPDENFAVGDAAPLGFADAAFDIVFNQVVATRLLDLEKVIAESARVARHAVILSSLGVFEDRPTAFLARQDHGAPAVEMVFNRGELVALLARHGLQVARSWHALDYDVRPLEMARYVQAWHWPSIAPLHSETFLCTKL